MARRHLPFFEEHSEPLAQRIATGLHKVGLALKQQSWVQANEEGLSATQGQILAELVARGRLTGTELSQRLGLTLTTISESVRVLAEKALVKKSPDPRHPRASLITPTARGKSSAPARAPGRSSSRTRSMRSRRESKKPSSPPS
jgi:DNA-binding MarR family transcriptional regulator